MPLKVTKEKFIQALEDNEEGLTNYELAAKLGISEQYFYDLRKKYKDEIRNKAKEIIKERAITIVDCMCRNAYKGDTKAQKILLEIIGLYTPGARTSVDINLPNLPERMRRAEARENGRSK